MKSDALMSAIESRARALIAAIMLILVGAVSGCAHNNPRDPFEPFNRGVYSFNDTVDNLFLKPVATGYRAVLPQFARTGVRNFFSNLDDVTVTINSVLQFKLPQALSDAGRFVINSTVGLLGVLDVATHLGLEKHNEDFGQTLGYWGVGSGPYLVLPFWGPSSVRDGIGRVADMYTDVVWYIDHIRTRNIMLGTRIVSNREQLLDSEKILDTAALDRYAFIRDAYLQRRRNLVYDGNPPPEPEEEAQPAKPRTETPPPPVSMLVDQFGGLVAGPVPEVAPTEAPAPAPSSASSAPGGSGGAGDPPAPAASASDSAPVPMAARSEPAAENGTGSHGQPRFVRVWLNGSR